MAIELPDLIAEPVLLRSAGSEHVGVSETDDPKDPLRLGPVVGGTPHPGVVDPDLGAPISGHDPPLPQASHLGFGHGVVELAGSGGQGLVELQPPGVGEIVEQVMKQRRP